MKSLWNSFKAAFAMFSKIPMPMVDWKKENIKYMMCFFPFVGTAIGILTGHGVHHQQGLIHGNGSLDVHQLLHQHFIDLQAACRIQNNDVVAVVLGVCQCLTGDLRRLCAGQGEHRCTGLLATTCSWSIAAGR